jgi:hypothetical protein
MQAASLPESRPVREWSKRTRWPATGAESRKQKSKKQKAALGGFLL